MDPDVTGATAESRLRSLTDFAKALTMARWSDDVLTIVASEAMSALEADHVALRAWERESGWLRTLVNVGRLSPHEEDRPTTELYPISVQPGGWESFEQGQGYVSVLALPDQPADQVQQMLADSGRGSAMAVPVVVDGRTWGELFVTRISSRQPFSAADLDFATAVAVQVGAGVGQAEHLARVERLAYADPLTGLANRRLLEDHLALAMSRHSTEGMPVTLVIADLNNLKRINDERGHEAGDVALRAVARQLSVIVAEVPNAMAFRLGGDEFCVLATGCPADLVVQAAHRFASAVRRTLPDGVSVGVASTEYLTDRLESPSTLFRIADAAQYRAKRSRQRTPVVAGLPTPTAEGGAPTPGAAERRRWRESVAEPGRVLQQAADLLADPGLQGPAARVAAVAAEMCRLADGGSWWVSRLQDGDDRFVTVDSGVSRVPASEDSGAASFYDDGDGYRAADYPASVSALGGRPVVVERDDPDADPAEGALLALGGFVEMAIVGGWDRTGTGWLAEIYSDEVSVPVREYALVFQAVVAMALAGA